MEYLQPDKYEKFVAILVVKHSQPLSDAWNATMTEFLMIANLDNTIKEETGGMFDQQRLDQFEEHLRKMGIEGV